MGETLARAIDQLVALTPEEGKEYEIDYSCMHPRTWGRSVDGDDVQGESLGDDGMCSECRATGGVLTMRITRRTYSNERINFAPKEGVNECQ